jgi:hypothetical protein
MSQAFDQLVSGLSSLAASMQEHQRLSVQSLTPVVERLIACGSRDAVAIEQTLDRLLDHGEHPGSLILFKSLCRHYYTLDSAATVEYINIYREMWDNEDEQAEVEP